MAIYEPLIEVKGISWDLNTPKATSDDEIKAGEFDIKITTRKDGSLGIVLHKGLTTVFNVKTFNEDFTLFLMREENILKLKTEPEIKGQKFLSDWE